MKIENITHLCKKIPLETAFRTSTGDVSNSTCLFVRIETDEGMKGYGCGYPTSLTGESFKTASYFSELFTKEIKGENPLRFEHIDNLFDRITYANPSVKSAFNTALWDIVGKYYDAPLYKLLGYDKSKILTSITIGLDETEKMTKEAIYWVRKGFGILKIKLGQDPKKNIEIVEKIREGTSSETTIRCDANGAMSIMDAIRFAKDTQRFNIEFIEQPVSTVEDMIEITKASPTRIAGDETIMGFNHLASLLGKEAFHIANIKMNRFGGVSKAMKMSSLAQGFDVPCMIGCMSETQISIAASLHLALSHSNIKYADLDTYLFLKYQPAEGLKLKNGMLLPSSKPGLGIEVDKRIFKKM
ncbi:MAG: mandelate racemase/muconate lactonizing enzyme family protein [Candidatus Methanofastidiosia archaeon]